MFAYLLQLRRATTNGYIATLCHEEWLYTAMDIAKNHTTRLGLYLQQAFIAIGLSEPFSSRSRYTTNCLQ